MSDEIRAIEWKGGWRSGVVEMIDQRRLPAEEIVHAYETVGEVARAIEAMVIRGAPAIGIAAAMGTVLGARALLDVDAETRQRELVAHHQMLAETRPTAVNLFWALERMARVVEAQADASGEALCEALHAEAQAIHAEDVAMNRRIGRHGAALFEGTGLRLLTHCNTGSLATGGYGTALGVIRACHEAGKVAGVWVDETRPYLQGARLTAWECIKEGIPATLITDSMAGFFMQRGEVDGVVIGADRIAANGDTANKIGSYTLAVLCRHHGVPFYVAAPTSTLDLATPSGAEIPIEERAAQEVTSVLGASIAPLGVVVRHPAFDVTPAALITGIITEAGVATAPYGESLAALKP